MKDIYTKGGYVSDEPYVSPPVIHRSECPPFTLNRSGKKTGELNPRIDHGIIKQIMDIIQARKHLKEHEAELKKYQSLSRVGLLIEEVMFIDKRIVELKQWISNIKAMLNAK